MRNNNNISLNLGFVKFGVAELNRREINTRYLRNSIYIKNNTFFKHYIMKLHSVYI